MPTALTGTNANSEPASDATPRALTELRPGDTGRLQSAELVESDKLILGALGLVDHSRLRLCKAGDPWIVQVRGTRIGIAEAVARRLQIVPEA